jgi:hypothetical protein
VPARSEGTECGQRNSQRLSHHDWNCRTASPTRGGRSVCGDSYRDSLACTREKQIPRSGRMTKACADIANGPAGPSIGSLGQAPGIAQMLDSPCGGFGEDGVLGFGVGPQFELGQKLLLAAIAHRDGYVAQQSASFCSFYRGASELLVELLWGESGEPCEGWVDELGAGEIGFAPAA